MTLQSAGSRNQRILIRTRTDKPIGFSEIEQEYSNEYYKLANVKQPKSSTYLESVQTDNIVTHYFTIEVGRNEKFTTNNEIVWQGMIYQIKRVRWLDPSKKRYLLIECEEIGEYA